MTDFKAAFLDELTRVPRDYAEAKLQAERLDALLELDAEAVEARLATPTLSRFTEQSWMGLPLQSMLTPYSEFAEIISTLDPKPGEQWIDLGAGYGRLGVTLAFLRPGVRFTGYELVAERVSAVHEWYRKLGLSNDVVMVCQDLSDPNFRPEAARVYFVYDFGTRDAIVKSLEDLRQIASKQKITVVARGRSSRNLIDRSNPWLSQVNPPIHRETYSLYRT